MTNRNERPGAVLVPILAGLAGFSLALLFAPRSGRETREKLQMTANDMKRQAQDGITTVRGRLESNLDQARTLKDRVASAIKPSDNDNQQFNSSAETATHKSSILTSWDEEV